MTTLMRHIEGTDAHGYADSGEGVILLTVDTDTSQGYRTVIDTDLDRASAATLIVQLLDAYGVEDGVKGAIMAGADRAMASAIQEVGW